MCISPIRIRNPNYNSRLPGAKYKDTTSLMLSIPCGFCPQCIAVKQMYYVQRCQVESLTSHLFFCTLTYNNDMIPKITTSTGYDISFADIHDVQNMFKRMRKHNDIGRDFSYIFCSEYGGQRGRPHFHILFFVPKFPSDDFNTCLTLENKLFCSVKKFWSRNIGTRKNPDYVPCCTYVSKFHFGRISTTLDLHYVNPASSPNGEQDVSFYVCKYLLKSSPRIRRLQQALKLNLPDDEYDSIWKLVKPRIITSKHFGLRNDIQRDYVKNCVALSRGSEFAKFFTSDGKSFPLARYYKTKGDIYSLDDYLSFPHRDDFAVVSDYRDFQHEKQIVQKFERNSKIVFESDISDEFDYLLENG